MAKNATISTTLTVYPYDIMAYKNRPIAGKVQYAYFLVYVGSTSTPATSSNQITLQLSYKTDVQTSYSSIRNFNIGTPYTASYAFFIGAFTVGSTATSVSFKLSVSSSAFTATDVIKTYSAEAYSGFTIDELTQTEEYTRIKLNNLPKVGLVRLYRDGEIIKEAEVPNYSSASGRYVSFDDYSKPLNKDCVYEARLYNYITNDNGVYYSQLYDTLIGSATKQASAIPIENDALYFQFLTSADKNIKIKHFSRNFELEHESQNFEKVRLLDVNKRYEAGTLSNKAGETPSLTLYAYNKDEHDEIQRLASSDFIFRIYNLFDDSFIGHVSISENNWNLTRDNKYFSTFSCKIERLDSIV